MDRLDVIDLHKEFEGKPLLEGVNFHVTAGETLCLLGSSGSGKSTILRIIAGIETPDAGQLLWNGGDLTPIPVFRRRFGLMFQDYALFPHLSVKENVAFGLRMQNLSRTEIAGKVRAALERVNMSAFADRRVTDLSGGEQQRIALARALVARPRLLMLDEPLGALDRALREQLSADLWQVLERMDIPVIYVTHDQQEAFAFADRLLILHDGRIIQSGTPQEVYNRPQSPWLAEFMGHRNHLAGKVARVQPLKVQTAFGLFKCGQGFGKLRDGQAVTLVLPANAAQIAQSGGNLLRAQVRHAQFQGSGFMIDFQLADGSDLAFFFNQALPVGAQTGLYIQPKSILCYA
jgi:spermidine/putrescine transport system ATP-binding protein